MTDFPIYVLLICSSLMLLGISVASATAQYLRSQQARATVATIKSPINR
jgi:hypothetical protein